MFILDSHCDSPTQMLRLRDFLKDNPAPAQVDFPKMQNGGVGGAFFALYIPASLSGDAATARAYELLDVLESQVPRAQSGENGAPHLSQSACELVRCAAEALSARERGLVSIFLGLENGSAIQEDFSILDDLERRGVRYMTLTHCADNQICDSCTGEGRWGGLSPFGRSLVEYLDSSDVYVDLAHCSDSTMEQVLDIAHKPVLYTHGCCRAISC